jgi:hypothetical protein
MSPAEHNSGMNVLCKQDRTALSHFVLHGYETFEISDSHSGEAVPTYKCIWCHNLEDQH